MQGNEGPQGQNATKHGPRPERHQGANRNVPQEEMLLNMDPGGGPEADPENAKMKGNEGP